MSMYINSDNNMILIRRKDSGVLRLVFERPMNGVFVTFAVKENKDDPDEDALISKSYQCGYDPTISPYEAYFFIQPEDTADFDIFPKKNKLDFQDFYWMVKIETNNGLLADTVIPSGTDAFPKFRVYYGSVPDYDIPNTYGIIG